jgi:hypothetical protein
MAGSSRSEGRLPNPTLKRSITFLAWIGRLLAA